MHETTMELKSFLQLLLRHLKWIVFFAVAGALAAFSISRWLVSPRYTSAVSLYVDNTGRERAGSGSVNINDINAAQKLVNTYVVILQDDAVMEQVAERLRDEYPASMLETFFPSSPLAQEPLELPQTLREHIHMRSVDGTEVLQIQAETTDADLSARICSIVAELTPGILQRVIGAGSVEVIGPPRPATRPSSPHLLFNTGAGLFLGGFLSVLAVLIRDRVDTTVRDTHGLKQRFPFPVLGEIPHHGSGGAAGKNKMSSRTCAVPAVPVLRQTSETLPPAVEEAYRTVRTNLLFLLVSSPSRAVVFSSALPGEGKSTACSNLAVSLSQTGASVLLVDADLRQPVQARLFRVPNTKGLSAILEERCTLEDGVIREVEPNLDLIPSGPCPRNPLELLTSDALRTLLETLSKRYDYLLIDSPPINPMTDAVILGDRAAGIVFVARPGAGTYEQLSQAVESVKFSTARILGIVLNGTGTAAAEKRRRNGKKPAKK